MSQLPEELIVEVFLRLPRKSLLRSRCVWNGLRSLIDSPIFKKRYHVFHNSVSDFKVMVLENHRLFSMDFHLPGNVNSCIENQVTIQSQERPIFIGCCNGIVCLKVSSGLLESYLLLNPFNGTFQKVGGSNDWSHFHSYYFGYDYATDDYKIVKFERDPQVNVQYFVVYSMRRDSWRYFDREYIPGSFLDAPGICVEGALHWVRFIMNDSALSIDAFDLETESLRSVHVPFPVEAMRQTFSLCDLGGRLSVSVRSGFGTGSSTTTVWVMEEYGVETSWTPLFNINRSTFPQGFETFAYFPIWNNARLLCLELGSWLWLWLNTEDGSKENIEIQQRNTKLGLEAKPWVCVRSFLRLPCSDLQND